MHDWHERDLHDCSGYGVWIMIGSINSLLGNVGKTLLSLLRSEMLYATVCSPLKVQLEIIELASLLGLSRKQREFPES